MNTTEYQFHDFMNMLGEAAGGYVDFVTEVHERLTEMGCKYKVSSTKTYPFQVAYTMPNSRKGILNFYLRKKGLKVRVTIIDAVKHADILNSLPPNMVSQINGKGACVKLVDKCECLDKCTGFDFYIGETHYQKCRFHCFQFDVDDESIPFFLELLESEITERQ